MLDKLKTLLTDKITLLMALVGLLLVSFNVILVLLQINTTKSVAIIRYNSIVLPEFTRGGTNTLYVFALAPFVFYIVHLLLAVKMYEKSVSLAKIILGLSYIILLFGIIVSSAVINVNK